MKIDKELWNELSDLKIEMDDLKNELEGTRSKGLDEYRINDNRAREVEKALQAWQNSHFKQWQ